MDDFPAAEARALLARATRRSVRARRAARSRSSTSAATGRRCCSITPTASARACSRSSPSACAPRFRALAMDARGHGDSTHPEAPGSYAWARFAEDFAGVAERVAAECRRRRGCPLAVGHSFGGTSLLGAAKRRPGALRRASCSSTRWCRPAPRSCRPSGASTSRSLVERASKRRHDWPSRAEARAFFAERELFARFQPAALDLYVLDGLRERADGSVELKCPGAVEAAIFAGGAEVDVAALARGVATPALWLWAALGNFSRERYRALAAAHARGAGRDRRRRPPRPDGAPGPRRPRRSCASRTSRRGDRIGRHAAPGADPPRRARELPPGQDGEGDALRVRSASSSG